MRRAGIEPTGYKKEEENASKIIPPHKTACMSPVQSAVYAARAGMSQFLFQKTCLNLQCSHILGLALRLFSRIFN